MTAVVPPRRSVAVNAVYGLLNPIPFGFFVAALIFDVVYDRTGELLWGKSAAWLITIGLLFAIVPRLINLVQVWVTSRGTLLHAERLGFWLNLLGIVAAILNAFVHSRDAYAMMPAGVWLSACTVLLMSLAQVVVSAGSAQAGRIVHA